MVAPLRPLITPFTLSLCAAAAPHSRRSAAKARIVLNAVLNLLVFMLTPPHVFRRSLVDPRQSRRGGTFSRAAYADLRVGDVLSSRLTRRLAAGTIGCEPFTISCALRSLP